MKRTMNNGVKIDKQINNYHWHNDMKLQMHLIIMLLR